MPFTSQNKFAPAAVSGSSGSFLASSSFQQITNFNLTVNNYNVTSKWRIKSQSDGSGNFSYFGLGGTANADQIVYIYIYRNGSQIATYYAQTYTTPQGSYISLPTSSLMFDDINPPVGANQYQMYIQTDGPPSYFTYANMVVEQVE
jgi:hypothetical protein